MPNRLAHESSPYLLQHAENPVDWYPWCEEAFQRARTEQLPIFLSIGYSACHWCHVMEHESFENPSLAATLNDQFVSIKVDREERPDLDQIYMQAVQMLTGRGGWPMSVFLTPDGHPFFGGTYWPPHSRMGMPGFDQVLAAVTDAWQKRREQSIEQSRLLTERIEQMAATDEPAEGTADTQLLRTALGRLEQSFDFRHGGFGHAPKFPHSSDLRLLLRGFQRFGRTGLLEMVQLNLDKMAAGGIFDHLGGGFARYSVDEHWLVPHFEKMLYDNAQLATLYLEAYQVTGNPRYADIARRTCDYVLRDLTDPAGGFHSTEDADSEGEEGKFYVWTPAEIRAVLGDEGADRFCYVYDVTEGGNFEGHNILHLAHPWQDIQRLKGWPAESLEAEMSAARARLFAARESRVRPAKDDKILVSWNGLMIGALALGGWVLGEDRYVVAAQRAAHFLHDQLWIQPEQLLHTWRHGKAKLAAYLDDYACLTDALVTLHQADQDERWLQWAGQLAEVMLRRFRDPQAGGFYFTADNHERLITRTQDWYDSSVPSGNGAAAYALLRLGKLTGRQDFLEAAEETLQRGLQLMRDRSPAVGQLLLAADFWLGPTYELAIFPPPVGSPESSPAPAPSSAPAPSPAMEASSDTDAPLPGDSSHRSSFKQQLRTTFLPRVVWAFADPAQPTDPDSPLKPLLAGKRRQGDQLTIYPCSGFHCEAPVIGDSPGRLLLEQLAAAGRQTDP
jgi:uncharacterized protein